jgi:hypothetical protein
MKPGLLPFFPSPPERRTLRCASCSARWTAGIRTCSSAGSSGRTADYFQAGFYSATGLMQGRVVIAIHNRQGQLVAYAGRATGQAEPRYRFPPGFQKSLELFNLHRTLQGGTRQVVVVEGFFDCMHLHQAGFSEAVALMGSVLSETQQKLLLDHFGELVLMMDGDETGRRASRRIPNCARVTLAHGMAAWN